jgi:hypothetical protein
MKRYSAIGMAVIGLVLGFAASAAADGERLAQSMSKPLCAQVISCGTKDGEVKEYPTPCDARDDGATDVHPKTGPTCDAAK